MMMWVALLLFQAVRPPEVLQRTDAAYPASAMEARQEGTVVLLVTVDANGRVAEASVSQSAGAELDDAALTAMRKWTFAPALRDEIAIAARVRIPFEFKLPVPATQPTSQPAAETKGAEEEVIAVTVRGKRRLPQRSTSDFVIDNKVLQAAPHQNAGELLATAPGVYVARSEGDAVAHQIFLRGFDAEHGQDIELTANNMSVNNVSHIHGQGYADLGFILPDVVRSVRVVEGVYDPRQGDFAVAGSIDFDLGVSERGFKSRTSYGSFNTFRQAVVYAPREESEDTFGAAFITRTNGFGQNRSGLSGGALGQYALSLPAGFQALLHVSGFGARAGSAGVVRRDDLDTVGFYNVYPDQSAQAQSALSGRGQIMFQLERPGDNGSRTSLQLGAAYSDFTQRQNFTGYLQRALLQPEWVGRGDLVEQRNGDTMLQAKAYHRFANFELASWFSGQAETGISLRTDFVGQQQNLLQQPRNETWDKRVDAQISATDIGAYIDAHLRFTRWLHLRGGARADLLYYNVDDRLLNLTPAFRSQQHYDGYRRTALGLAAGPRLNLDIEPLSWLKVVLSYGEGYRSPQARLLDEGESAPFAKVRSAEVGVEVKPLQNITITAAGYGTWLSNDLIFDPADAQLERIGPTSRKGALLRVIAEPVPWLLASASLTYVNATLDAPPLATPENPAPPYQRGQLLPYVPPLVARLDVAAHGTLFAGVTGRIGLGFSALSSRPLPYGQWSPAFATLDAQASVQWRWFELGIEGYNVTNTRYAANEFVFTSNWPTRQVPSLVPARHVAAAAPIAISGVLTVRL